jgi:hypothetical protein
MCPTYRVIEPAQPQRSPPGVPRRLSPGARVGVWLGTFGWFLGVLVVAAPQARGLAGELVGGFAVSLAAALVFEVVARRATRFGVGVAASVCLAMAMIGTYHALVVQPALFADTRIVVRLGALQAEARFPLPLAAALGVVGLVLLVMAFRPPRRAGSERLP